MNQGCIPNTNREVSMSDLIPVLQAIVPLIIGQL